MKSPQLICVFFPDLRPWERTGPETVLRSLQSHYSVKIVEHNHSGGAFLKEMGEGSVWILAKDWQSALRKLGGRALSRRKVFVSIFDFSLKRQALSSLFFKRMKKKIPSNVTLISHSPLSYRFFQEFERLGDSQLKLVPFPTPELAAEVEGERAQSEGPITVGTFSPFQSEGNLNYFINIAHYVSRRNPNTKFRILGSGPLYEHLNRLVVELGLEEVVSVSESFTGYELSMLDVFLYLPLRNDHFLPLLAAASLKLPVLSTMVPGIEEFILDGQTGFLVPNNETKPMGELILRLSDSRAMRTVLGKKVYQNVVERFSVDKLQTVYRDLFSEWSDANVPQKAA